MTPRQLDLAAEFCERVGAADLLQYLGIEADSAPDDARAALKARRRKMQGMQANPKYADEARLLIKHFQTLDAVLANPPLQVQDMAKRQEAKNLPALELSIKTALAGGPLSPEQTRYMRSSARDLGVSDAAFDRLLQRLQRSDAVDPATAPTAPSPAEDRGRSPRLRRDLLDVPEELVGTTQPASTPPATIRRDKTQKSRSKAETPRNTAAAPRSRGSESKQDSPTGPTLKRTRRKSSGLSIHDPLDLSLSEAATAPPVRTRTAAPRPTGGATTQPRPTQRATLPRKSANIEIVGEHAREVIVSGRPGVFDMHVRLLGELPIAAKVATDDDWLSAEPERLAPEHREHAVHITVDPRKMYRDVDVGSVIVYNDLGDRVGITVRANRRFNWYPYLLTSAIVTTTVAVAALLVVAFQTLSPIWFPSHANSLTIRVDPSSETVLLDGRFVGRGPAVRIPRPLAGPHEINVLHHNFDDESLTVELVADEDRIVNVRLGLSGPLNYKPPPEAREHLLPEDPEKRASLERQFQPCVAKTPRGHRPYRGNVTIYLGPGGQVLGVHFEGHNPVPAVVATCLKRQAATVRYPRLEDGDYAVLNAEFSYP